MDHHRGDPRALERRVVARPEGGRGPSKRHSSGLETTLEGEQGSSISVIGTRLSNDLDRHQAAAPFPQPCRWGDRQ
eukprot:1685057-Alexandrium_andersonii.AAC.1